MLRLVPGIHSATKVLGCSPTRTGMTSSSCGTEGMPPRSHTSWRGNAGKGVRHRADESPRDLYASMRLAMAIPGVTTSRAAPSSVTLMPPPPRRLDPGSELGSIPNRSSTTRLTSTSHSSPKVPEGILRYTPYEARIVAPMCSSGRRSVSVPPWTSS